MSQRNEILEALKLLNYNVEEEGLRILTSKSDLELLRILLEQIKSRRIPGDSLAFPSDFNARTKLTNSTELWNHLDRLNASLNQDFTCRRQMLLQRLDCTVESFKWKGVTSNKVRHEPRSGNGKSLNDRIHEIYDNSRVTMREEAKISISDLLATRAKDCDRLLNGVVSSKGVDCEINYGNKQEDTKVNLKQVIIPHVPDRGGRTDEIRQPAKESYSQQKGGYKRGQGRHR